jgi:UDP-N-acetylmuramyl pentapeptide synthase
VSAVTAAVGLSLQSVVDATGGRRVTGAGAQPILTSVSIDSRTLEPGALFVAIRGPRFDGHDFLAAAHAELDHAVMCRERRSLEHRSDASRQSLSEPHREAQRREKVGFRRRERGRDFSP